MDNKWSVCVLNVGSIYTKHRLEIIKRVNRDCSEISKKRKVVKTYAMNIAAERELLVWGFYNYSQISLSDNP